MDLWTTIGDVTFDVSKLIAYHIGGDSRTVTLVFKRQVLTAVCHDSESRSQEIKELQEALSFFGKE